MKNEKQSRFEVEIRQVANFVEVIELDAFSAQEPPRR
jgi:hypothetical protein